MGINVRQARLTDPFMPEDLKVIEQPQSPSASALFGSIWRTSFTKGVADWFVESSLDDEFNDDPNYAPDPAKLNPRYRPIWPEISKAGSLAKAQSLMYDYDEFNQDVTTIANAGVPGMLAAGTFAMVEPATLPLWFLPFGKGFQAAGIAGKAGRITGVALADATAREAVMHHIDLAREPNDTAKMLFVTAGAAGALGTLVGAISSKVPKPVKDKMVNEFKAESTRHYDNVQESGGVWTERDIPVEEAGTLDLRPELNARVDAARMVADVPGGSVGAMAVNQEKIWDEAVKLQMPQNTFGIQKAMIQTPQLRMAFSPKRSLSEPSLILQELVYSGVETKAHSMFVGDAYKPLEAMVKRERELLGNTLNALKQAGKTIKKDNGDKLSTTELSRIASVAAAGGDDMARYPELLPIIKEAREFRENFVTRMKKVGMYEEPIVVANANKTRAVEKATKQRNGIEERLTRAETQLAKLQDAGEKAGIKMKKKDVAKYEKQLTKHDAKTEKSMVKFDDDIADAKIKDNEFWGPRVYDEIAIRKNTPFWLRDVVAGYRARGSTMSTAQIEKRAMDSFYNAATESKTGEWAADFGKGVRKPAHLKSRTLKLDDSYIEDYLVRDLLNDHETIIKNLMPELILRERGYEVVRADKGIEVPEFTKRLKDEFQYKHKKMVETSKRLSRRLKAKGDTAGAIKAQQTLAKRENKLIKGHEQDLKDLHHIMLKVTGVGEDAIVITGPVAEFLGELRGYSGGAHLGNSALASLHEPITEMMVMGFTPVAKATGAVIFKGKAPSGWVEDNLRAFGLGMDLRSQQTTALARAEVDGTAINRGWKSWGRRKVAPFTMQYNGQNLFNAVGKSGAATAHQDQLIRFSIGKQTPKAGSAEYVTQVSTFAKTGMNKADLTDIKAMFDQGKVTEYNGSYFANLGEWPEELRNKMVNSMYLFGEGTIVSHGSGAVPIIADNPIGKMFTQYRNVFFNMQGKVIIPIAQRLGRGDMRTARFLTAQFGVAWLIYQTRLLGKVGYDMDKFEAEWSKMAIQDHVYQTINASGSLGLWPEVLAGADNLSNGNATRLLGLNEGTKNFYNRNLGLTGLSPGISWADKMVRGTIGAVVSGQPMTQGQVNGLMYGLPGRTIPYLDPAIDAIQSSVVEGFPKGTSRARRTREKRKQF